LFSAAIRFSIEAGCWQACWTFHWPDSRSWNKKPAISFENFCIADFDGVYGKIENYSVDHVYAQVLGEWKQLLQTSFSE